MVPKRKKIAMYVAMIIITAIVVFPFLWMVLLSFKSSSEIMSNPLAMPKAFNLDNFKHALETLNFPQLYANTFVVCILSVVLELIITFCSSFVIKQRVQLVNKKWIFDFGIICFTIYFIVPGI